MKPQLESVSISGTAQVGATLTASVEPAGATVSYQWLSAAEQDGDYTDITGAVNGSYELTEAESGKYIKVKSTGTGEYAGEVTSEATGPVSAAVSQAAARKRV